MTLVGFKRATIRVLDGQAATAGTNLFVVEGKKGEGATQTVDVTGLSSTPIKVFGSNIAYYVANKGVGDVKAELTLLDILEKVNDILLGYKVKDKLTYIGEESEPPYCSLLLESETLAGEKAYFGFLQGQFSRDAVNMKTKKGTQEEPDGDKYEFTSVASDDEDTKGNYVVKYIGKEEETIKKLKQQMKIAE
ncbi:phage tail protein [Streptococcus sp. HMSC056D07]|uniref:major tail protein n=1 Tax=Streptococcus sp. HMSC056D07 TaxID=1739474 RepID=UPI0008A4B66B|nr:major tail protein [Streptococcus sp. HMSC056D07]OFP79892.1 phage tail protein [Streptococcus sp. HMSC056D07]